MKTTTKTLQPALTADNLEPKDDTERFVRLVNAGINAWIEAGQLLVRVVESDPTAFKRIMVRCPAISIDVLLAFEQIGRRKLYTYVLLDTSPGGSKLRTYHYDLQVKYYHERIPVVIDAKSSPPIVAQKMVAQLGRGEVDRVMGPIDVRSVDEQVRLIKQLPGQPLTSTLKSNSRRTNNKSDKERRSMGVFKIIKDERGALSIVEQSRDAHPFAIPVEFVSQSETEAFEIFV